MQNKFDLIATKGNPYPFGVSLQAGKLNFSVVSKQAKSLIIRIMNKFSRELIAQFAFDPNVNKTGIIWHLALPSPEDLSALVYTYIIDEKELLDPYAKGLNSSINWGTPLQNLETASGSFSEGVVAPAPCDFGEDRSPRILMQDLIIYEMHVRGFTIDPSSGVEHPGKFLGVIEKIPYLLDLGINAVELLPIQEFDECEYARFYPYSSKKLYNYWGYSSVNFFSPMNRYASSSETQAAVSEFKAMVRELHRNGIELILDIVFNHTAEGGETGPHFSFKGFDQSTYYMIDEQGNHRDYTGCGNTFNANHPVTMNLILDALRYWVVELHVDGFRFDLASALNREMDGTPHSASALIRAISEDPCLAQVKLIAEPWDAVGFYQVGTFAKEHAHWSEWNDKYRNTVRRFIKGTPGSLNDFSRRISGSEDLYHKRSPLASVNFITAHDGFCLADLVSYNHKHNVGNGENNRDGSNDNESWNCGVEGTTSNENILSLRERQRRNLHLTLMVSQGVPMLLMGDEYGHTKYGNNNSWCQDNELNWFLWKQLEENASFYRFYRLMIHFRKRHPLLRRTRFLTHDDVEWHGKEPFKPEWNSASTFLAYTLKAHKDGSALYIAFNAQSHGTTVYLPPAPQFQAWRWVANSANPSPHDFFEEGEGPLVLGTHFPMQCYSSIILSV